MKEIFERTSLLAFAAAFALSCCGNEPKPAEPKQEAAPLPEAKQEKVEPQAAQPVESAETKSAAKKVLFVIAPADFRDEELFETKKTVEDAGYLTVISSTRTDEATGMLGGKAKPDITITESRVDDYDAIVFVGGSGAKVLLNDEAALSLAKAADEAGKLVAAICMAPEILANAGLLKGKSATCWGGGRSNLESKGAIVKDASVVEDGRLITGDGPAAAREFGEAIVRYLNKN